MKSSDHLIVGQIYTRKDLKARFGIVDAHIYNGVFRPAGHASIWLFVTEIKTSDRTPYRDRLEGNTLYWDGQLSGRTDKWIIDHKANGEEILVFYRKSKHQYPGAGFRYEGLFEYVRHEGQNPTRFVLKRVART